MHGKETFSRCPTLLGLPIYVDRRCCPSYPPNVSSRGGECPGFPRPSVVAYVNLEPSEDGRDKRMTTVKNLAVAATLTAVASIPAMARNNQRRPTGRRSDLSRRKE